MPDQVVVIWQADDVETRDTAERLRTTFPFALDVLHSEARGIVPAENLALAHATGDLIALIDDDAEAAPDWLARHLGYLADSNVGAVGGPAINYKPDGSQFPPQKPGEIGRVPWSGQPIGNMYDHPAEWASRQPIGVDHLVGYNMVLRRAAFDRFEAGLRPYWQFFELDACLQARARGFKVLFDHANVVRHFPTNVAYEGGRDGDLGVKIYNAAYNLAFVQAKHSPWFLMAVRLAWQLAVGRVGTPGLAAAGVGVIRYGRPLREIGILVRSWAAVVAGWRDGLRRRLQGGRMSGTL